MIFENNYSTQLASPSFGPKQVQEIGPRQSLGK